MADIKAINNSLHGNIKVKANPTLVQAKDKHFAPVVVQEFVAACQEFPIVFVKEGETGQFKSIALLGLKPEQNLFFAEDAWQARYKPQALTLYPFLLNQAPDSEQAILCFDQDSPLINENEGEAFFDSEGKQSAWLSEQGERVVKYVENTYITGNFIKMLLELDLLSSQTLNLKLADQAEYSLNGLYAIDEKKLNALDDEQFAKLRKTGALPAIYASLISMQRIHSLASIAIGK
ncbi:SapC family protein [Thalassotalea sp. ND16A]|uniref:SapC family protein n=1 Tax=Thalassotalea sp. ND16A TaxID=1535422 RepID=UPI00051A6BB9|nr:SapC family protein [Thalassotalea sp. ND16A]KGK01000.1 hypothetical protein ND16A_3202 [Thalassotalea sp. ND16A]